MAQVRERKTVQTVDGVSFMPMLEGKPTRYDKRNLYWNYPNLWGGNEGPGIGSTCTVRRGDWKLIYYYETGKKELFNITNDIGETANRAEQNPRLVKSCRKSWESFYAVQMHNARHSRLQVSLAHGPMKWTNNKIMLTHKI